MRVLFYSSIFPRPWNTTRGIYCFHACRALQRLGHEVRVVSPRSWLERAGSATSLAGLAGLDALEVQYPLYFYPPRILHSEHDRFMALSTRRVTRRAMRELRPDAILSYWAHPDGAVAARLAHEARIPSAVIVGGSDVLVLTRRPGRRRRAVVRALHATSAIVTVGRQLADAVVALGIPARKVHVVYQGIDPAFSPGPASEARRRLGLPEGGKVLVSVGSLIPVKGLDVLLPAVARLAARREDLRLYLVGEGAERGELEALSARLGLQSVVHFDGRVEHGALPDWYRAADLSVLASRSEGVPNVLRESLACGTPFVATRVGGVDEIAAGTESRLVPPGDVGALSEAIERSLSEPRPAFSRERLSTWEQSTAQIVELFERARAELAARRP
jgi:glycosyltransferase involved in cell wall biosynthesis